MTDQLITKHTTVLNFGCGYNDDGRILCDEGTVASGWDRHFTPHGSLDAADVVLLNFVLNTIEHAAERETVTLIAYALAKRALVIAVRTDKQGWAGQTTIHNDGIVTEHETFQKIYEHEAFCQLIANTLQRPAHGVKSGIVYVFRDEVMQEAYLKRHPRRRSRLFQPQQRYTTKP